MNNKDKKIASLAATNDAMGNEFSRFNYPSILSREASV